MDKNFGWRSFSLVDSPTGSAAVVYVFGCNLKCPYCFNPELRQVNKGTHTQAEIITEIKHLQKCTRDGNRLFNPVDWLIISGGEPLFSETEMLYSLFRKAKDINLNIGLFTSGCHPIDFKMLLDNIQLDYVHIDYKGPIFESSSEVDAATLECINYAYKKEVPIIHINTTIMLSIHTPQVLKRMHSNLLRIRNNDVPILLDKPETSPYKFYWTLTPISWQHTNTLTEIDYNKDGFINDDLTTLRDELTKFGLVI